MSFNNSYYNVISRDFCREIDLRLYRIACVLHYCDGFHTKTETDYACGCRFRSGAVLSCADRGKWMILCEMVIFQSGFTRR